MWEILNRALREKVRVQFVETPFLASASPKTPIDRKRQQNLATSTGNSGDAREHEPHRELSGQRADGELLGHAQARVCRPTVPVT